MRCFSPRLLIGTTPGSTTTTTPTINWLHSRTCRTKTINNHCNCKLIHSYKLTVFVTKGTRSRASDSLPSNSTTTTSKLVQVNTALELKDTHYKSFLSDTCSSNSPFSDLLVAPQHCILYVYRVVVHAPQGNDLVQRTHYVDCVVQLLFPACHGTSCRHGL